MRRRLCLRLIGADGEPRRLLDIGSGIGQFIEDAHEVGPEPIGEREMRQRQLAARDRLQVRGTGRGGRVTKKDMLNFVESGPPAEGGTNG
jgi:hypothetical protein